MSTDPYATTSSVKNILQHLVSPKIVNDGSGGYVVKTDLVNVDNIVSTGSIVTSSMTISAPRAISQTVQDITISVNSGSAYVPRWAISHNDAETGGSSGSNFCLNTFNDNGVMSTALSINRLTSNTTIQGNVSVNGSYITAPAATLNCSRIISGGITSTNRIDAAIVDVSGNLDVGGNLVVTNTLTTGNNLVFRNPTYVGEGTLLVGGSGKIAFTNQSIDFTTYGNSSNFTRAGGFVRMIDSTGGIGFGDGSTTGGVLTYGPNSVPTSVSGFLSGSTTYSGGTTTFGTNSSSLAGNAVFNNAQAGVFTVSTSAKTASVTINGLTSNSIVMVTPRGTVVAGAGTPGSFGITTSTNTLTITTERDITSYPFYYFIARF